MDIERADNPTLVPISALQHWLFCPRQCALIHNEQVWQESALTAEGRVLHERAHTPIADRRGGVRTVRAMPLRSHVLGLVGVADVVEMHAVGKGAAAAFPVEYKRGRPKAHRADEVQLCAQALCLEEMLGRPVPSGALFYGTTKRRHDVTFDDALRRLTISVIEATSTLFSDGTTPRAVYAAKRCDPCSLIEMCRPRQLEKPRVVERWLARQIED
ncbi:CRISPR-associated protein Cas4 [Marinivivus vitaminiproducens]|uniref:CRISPR-associated protein Cas4 n=1 Tax=Marinivivus vitaminiproducens TaxID=3035935 RepID=UPI00279BB151|nr:CRISPR-associated protein Cas4 [Geminicoccaceae bacterium SCSIO 64248]